MQLSNFIILIHPVVGDTVSNFYGPHSSKTKSSQRSARPCERTDEYPKESGTKIGSNTETDNGNGRHAQEVGPVVGRKVTSFAVGV